jgi:hypothetical protein
MIIYIDENFPPQLAQGFNILSKPRFHNIEVKSIKDTFGTGCKDEDWIPQAGAQGAAVLTQDLNINRSRSQKELYLKNNLGVFFFKPPSKNGYQYWEMVGQIVKRWESIVEHCNNSKKPFAFLCRAKGADFESIV